MIKSWDDLKHKHKRLLDSINDDLSAAEGMDFIVYPPKDLRFAAFDRTPFSEVKVVILGQDPYHNGAANGLAFSTDRGNKIPASLRNIYIELVNDIGCEKPTHGDLSSWADQGVLLMNTCLTVDAGKAGSHASFNWQEFTGDVIRELSLRNDPPVFILWGKKAQLVFDYYVGDKEVSFIRSPHPSPFSAGMGFFNSKPFSRTNELLVKNGHEPIDWSINE